jgi:3-dehydrosphinganine reductase
MTTEFEKIPWVHPFTLATLTALTIVTSILHFLIPEVPRGDKKSHAVITGGSSGIGFEIAIACAKAGIRNITLVARNQEALETAKIKLSALYPSTQFQIHSLDISDYEAVKVTAPAIVEKGGPPTLLFNNAGVTSVHSFQNVPVTDFESLMKCNYLGTVYMTKSLLEYMPSGSTIMITSSMAGCVGVYGYTAYSPTKFALRGFAESLQMEVRNDGITISIACPPDTDTPMLEAENKTKPRETTLISDSAGLMKPDE